MSKQNKSTYGVSYRSSETEKLLPDVVTLPTTEMPAEQPFIGSLEVAYLATYPFDGLDPVNSKASSAITASHAYAFHPLTVITSFLGLPNRDLSANGKQSIQNLFMNLVGWDKNKNVGRIIFNILKMPLIIVWHLAIACIKLTTNIIKLVTEFLPLTVAEYTRSLIYKAVFNVSDEYRGDAVRIAYVALIFSLSAIYLLSSGVFILGRAVTSPHKSVRAGWLAGRAMASNPVWGVVLGTVLAMASIGITVLIYALALPIAAKYVAAITLPHLPAVVMSVLNQVGSIILPALDVVAKAAFMPIVQPIFHLIGVSVSPGFVALSALALTTITTIGTATSKLKQRIENWWFKPTEVEPYIERSDLVNSTTKMTDELPRKQVKRTSQNAATSRTSTVLTPSSAAAAAKTSMLDTGGVSKVISPFKDPSTYYCAPAKSGSKLFDRNKLASNTVINNPDTQHSSKITPFP